MKKMMALSLALAGCVALAVAGCGDDDDDNGAAGTGGSAGTGTAGTSAGSSAAGTSAGSSAAGTSAGTSSGGTSGGGSGGTSAGGTGGSDGTGTGPGSNLKCTSSGNNAYVTYGSAFGKVNDSIFANVTTEITTNGSKNLGSSFATSATSGQLKNDPAGFKKNLADFLIFAYGGPNNYKGRSMEAAHTGLAITQAQYDYFITNVVVKALTDNGVPMDDVTSCFAGPVTDPAFVATIINR